MLNQFTQHLALSIRTPQASHRNFALALCAACGLSLQPACLPAWQGAKPAAQKSGQAKPAPASKAPASPKSAAPQATVKPATKPGTKPATTKKTEAGQPVAAPSAAKTPEPATPLQAAKVLDLRTFPLIKGAAVSTQRTLGMLMYEVKSSPKAAFDFQRAELSKRGFQEQPGGYSDDMNLLGHFTNAGFHVAVSASALSGDPAKSGMSSVSLVNDGNVDVTKLPLPAGTKPFYPRPFSAAYTSDTKVPDAAAACRKLLLAAGWETYGQVEPSPNLPDSATQYFKRNAIKLQLWVSVTPNDGGKTLIQYSTELLSADLPAPPDIADPRYTDSQKTLRFDAPNAQTDKIIAFYQARLPQLGWKATTEKPISDDRDKSQFVIYRNAQQELLSLDLKQFSEIVRVSLKHQTAEELAEEERLAKAGAEKRAAEEAARNRKINVSVPLPESAGEVEKSRENVFEFTVATGSCPQVLKGLRKHFVDAGWKEEAGTRLDEQVGSMSLKKGEGTLTFSYFDIGLGDAEIKVSGSSNVVFETVKSKDKGAADAGKTKKPKPAAIPGLPELPPGVEIPGEVEDLVKKALEDAKPPRKPAPKKQSE